MCASAHAYTCTCLRTCLIVQDELITALRGEGRRQAAQRMMRQKRDGTGSGESCVAEGLDMSCMLTDNHQLQMMMKDANVYHAHKW